MMLEGIRSVNDIRFVLLPVLTFIGIVLLALYVWQRAGSSYSLLTRLWQLFHGKKEHKTPLIGQFLEDETALLQFRFTTGVRSRTTKQAQDLIKWLHTNNESIGHVAACGGYFDLEKVELKSEEFLPKPWHLLTRAFGTLTLFTLCIICAYTMITVDSAWLQVKKTKTYFVSTSSEANPFFSSQPLTRRQCMDSKSPPTSLYFSAEDVAAICELLKREDRDEYLDRTITLQRVVLGFCVFIFYLPLRVLFIWLSEGVNSNEMSRRLGKKKLETALTLVEVKKEADETAIVSGNR